MTSPSTTGDARPSDSRASAGILSVRAIDLLLLAGVVGALLLHASHYYPFFSDDALISLRYTQRLCAGEGLTWTEGRPVEGYTNLLWVLLNAPATCVGLDPMWSARALDFIGAAVAALVIALPVQGAWRPTWERAATGSALFLACGPVAAWAIAGLEHGFMFGVLALALHFTREAGPPTTRNALRAGLLFGALALLRADGVVLFAGATLGRFLTQDGRRVGLRAALAWFAFPVTFLLAQLAFRWSYYGELVPNTAVAKVSFSVHRLVQGLEHVATGLRPLSLLLITAGFAVALVWRRVPRTVIVPPLVTALVWMVYLASVGGDIFPGWRQLSLAIVPLCLLVADGGATLFARDAETRSPKTALLLLSILVAHLTLQFRDAENRRAKNELWEWDGLPIGTTLRQAFGSQRPLLAVDAAGALPYWSELPSLDMLGLNDHHIPRHPPPNFGRGVIGHELGDPDYVWERAPDLIAFCNARGNRAPCFFAGHALVRRRDFKRDYQLVRVRGAQPHPVGEIYFRREGGRLGITREADRLLIPGYFLGEGLAAAHLVGDTLATRITADEPGQLDRLEVPAGTWKVTTEPPLEHLHLGFACDGVSSALLDGAPHVIRLAEKTPLDLAAGLPPGAAADVHRLTLVRTDEAPGASCGAKHTRHAVERRLADLSSPPAEGAYWAAPGAVRLGRAGLRVDLGGPTRIRRVELSADNNDHYEVQFFRGSRLIGKVTAPPDPLPGLRTRKLDAIPEALTREGADTLVILGRRGDRSYSVGHVAIAK